MKTKNSKFILDLNFGQMNLGIIYLITLTEISLVLIIVVVFAYIFKNVVSMPIYYISH